MGLIGLPEGILKALDKCIFPRVQYFNHVKAQFQQVLNLEKMSKGRTDLNESCCL